HLRDPGNESAAAPGRQPQGGRRQGARRRDPRSAGRAHPLGLTATRSLTGPTVSSRDVVFRLETRARRRVANLAETRASGMAPKLSTSMGMNTRGMLERFTPFKRDSMRRIDRVIDYLVETRSMRGHRRGRRWAQ